MISSRHQSTWPWLAGALLVGLLAVASPAAHIRVFVLTGQSNSLGTTADPSATDITPGADPADANVGFFWSNRDTSGDNSPAGVIGDSGGEITWIQAQQGQGANPLFWGPEVQFARSLYAAGVRDALIIKGSRGGGGNTWWYKYAANPQMYVHVTNIVGQAVAALPPGDTFEIVGFLYLQGESDNSSEANLSGSRLVTLISNLRQDLPHASNMHAVVGGIAAAGGNRDTVRAQQAALAAGDPTIDYFSNLDLQGNLYDNLHFDKPAKMTVGDRYAQAFLATDLFAAEPKISEVMAVNTATVIDEDGHASPWLEITNPGQAPLDLGGYRLTDHPTNDAMWVFPSGFSLTGGARRVVFCSGKDRTPAAGELHTNFILPADGGYLALHDSTGGLLQAFDPATPQMFTDRSYGSPGAPSVNLVSQGDAARIAYPVDGSLGTNWVHLAYDDSDALVWTSGITGVGYETDALPSQLSDAFPYRYAFDGTDTVVSPGDPLPENIDNYEPAGADWFVGHGAPGSTATNGSVQHVAGGSGNWWEANPVWNSPGAGITSASGYTLELRARVTVGNGPQGLVMGVLGGPSGSATSGTFLNLIEDQISWGSTLLSAADGDNTDGFHIFRVAQRPGEASFMVWRDGVLAAQGLGGGHSGFAGRMILGDIGGAWVGAADIDYFRFTAGAYAPSGGAPLPPADPLYDHLIGTDAADPMFSARSGAYLRIPFVTDIDPADLASLMLSMYCDDGFYAWLNGVEIARRNAPAVPVWDAVAPANRDDRLGEYPEVIAVSHALGALVTGTNLLAVHALNHSAGAARFLVLPELRATLASPDRAYLSAPTPGQGNEEAVAALDAWRDEYFTPGQQMDDGISGLLADPDIDGRVNAFEFSCVTDPWTVTPGSPGVYSMETHGEPDPYLTVRYRFRLGAEEEVEPVVGVSGDLLGWNTGTSHTDNVGSPAYGGDGSETHTVRDAHAGDRRFMRLDLQFN